MPLIVVAAVAVLARLVALAVLRAPGGLLHQEPSAIAANINAGIGFVYSQYGGMYYALKEPGHIALLALVMRIFGDHDLPILALQWACGVAVAVLTAVFTRRLTGDGRAGVVAGLLVATNPFLVYYDSLLVHSLSLDMLLFVVTTAAVIAAADDARQSWPRVALAGAISGLALWQRSLLFFGGIGAWGTSVLVVRGARRRQLGRALVWAGIALLLVVPWFARNRVVVGRWLFTSDFAHVLWLGNNPLSNGTYSDGDGERIYYRADPAFHARIHGKSEVEQMEVFLDAVRTFVREHPGQAASLVLRRVAAFVWFVPNVGAEYREWQVAAYVVWYITLLVLGVAGAVRLWRGADAALRRRLTLLAGAVAGIVALHAVVAINMKHRVPFEIVLAGCAGVYIAGALRSLRRRPA